MLSDAHMAVAVALGADFMMLGRYFARFEESPSRLVKVNGQLYKEYWGEGSESARNWTRYDHREGRIVFEQGVDGYVPFAGKPVRQPHAYDDQAEKRLGPAQGDRGRVLAGQGHQRGIVIYQMPTAELLTLLGIPSPRALDIIRSGICVPGVCARC